MCAAVLAQPQPAPQPAGWVARLGLRIERRGDRSVLARRAHVGPLRVQRALYPEGHGVCHVVIVHPPGGVVGGDELRTDVDVSAEASALITTPAATKLYRSAGAAARVATHLRVAGGGSLEYVPQESMAFEGCRVRAELAVALDAGARFVGWEVGVLGRPAAGDRFAHGTFEQRIHVERSGRPVLIERAAHVGGDERLAAAWGLRGCAVVGTMIVVGATGLLDDARAALARRAGEAASAVTMIDEDVMVARYLGDDARAALAGFEAVRGVVRPTLLGRPAVAPRIWAT